MISVVPPSAAFADAILKVGARHRAVAVCAVEQCGVKIHRFAQQFASRFFDFGFSAQAMLLASAGMTVRGKIPFVCTQTLPFFSLREAISMPPVNVKIIYTGPVRDLAVCRALPDIKLFMPVDYWQTVRCVESALQEYGPVCIALHDASTAGFYDESYVFTPGKADFLRQGNDVGVVCAGAFVAPTMAAADLLAKKGISVAVLNAASLVPFDTLLLIQLLQQVKQVVTFDVLASSILPIFAQQRELSGRSCGVIYSETPDQIAAEIEKLV